MPSYRAMRALAILGWMVALITGRAEPIPPETAEMHAPTRIWTRTNPSNQDLEGPGEAPPAPAAPVTRRGGRRG